MIALVVITDGRDEWLQETIASARANLLGPIGERWMYDDSGDEAYRAELRKRYPGFHHFDAGPRQGFGGAIRAAWARLRESSTAPLIFHLEQDFTFNRMVNLNAMATVLEQQPHLVQMALRRQPWNQSERDAGGIIEQHPDDYAEACDGVNTWLEHRRFFTTNPSLYRRDLILDHDWPDVEHSEGVFTHQLLADPDLRFAFWGTRRLPPWVEHVGRDRVGTGY